MLDTSTKPKTNTTSTDLFTPHRFLLLLRLPTGLFVGCWGAYLLQTTESTGPDVDLQEDPVQALQKPRAEGVARAGWVQVFGTFWEAGNLVDPTQRWNLKLEIFCCLVLMKQPVTQWRFVASN